MTSVETLKMASVRPGDWLRVVESNFDKPSRSSICTSLYTICCSLEEHWASMSISGCATSAWISMAVLNWNNGFNM